MRPLIIAALLLASTPALAATSPSAAEWDCGNGVTVFSSKGEMGAYFSFGDKYRGTRKLDLKWDYKPRGSDEHKVWLNGKACKRSN